MRPRRQSILVVGNNVAVQNITCTILRRHGYRVISAATGQEALKLLQSEPPSPIDLVLLDLFMSDARSTEVAERILEMRPQARLLFFSDYSEEESTLAVGERIVRCVPRPSKSSKLIVAIRAALEDTKLNVAARRVAKRARSAGIKTRR
jgi:CheY-like chemotaxis protein